MSAVKPKRLCQACAHDCEWSDPIPAYDIPGQWHHLSGQWRVPADHEPVFMDGSGGSG